MAKYSKIVLEIGAGKDFKRARKAAEEHPDWLVVAIDPKIERTGRKDNLVAIKGSVGPKTKLKEIKANEVWMYNLSSPFAFRKDKLGKEMYCWITEENVPWLADEHEIIIVDNNTTNTYFRNREHFNEKIEKLKKIVGKYGYHVQVETIPREEIEFWDRVSVHKELVKLTLRKSAQPHEEPGEEKKRLLVLDDDPDCKRSKKIAEEHTNWSVIAVSEEIEKTARPVKGFENLEAIAAKFNSRIYDELGVIDEIWMCHQGSPFYSDLKGLKRIQEYEWILADPEDNYWLSEKHRIVIIDNSVSRMHETSLRGFAKLLGVFMRIAKQFGYSASHQVVPNEKITPEDKKLKSEKRTNIVLWRSHR